MPRDLHPLMGPGHLVDELREPVAGIGERQNSHARSIASYWREVGAIAVDDEVARSASRRISAPQLPGRPQCGGARRTDVSGQAEYGLECIVHRGHFTLGEVADEVSQPLGVHRGGLLDEDQGGLTVDLDLRTEAGGPRAGRGRRYEPGGERQEVGLDDDRIPVSALLMA